MKTGIHPKYFDSVEIRCSCGNIIISGSTKEKLKTELCSKCHPFYTGQQKLIDTAGRVDKFQAKRKKATDMKESLKKESESKKKKPEEYKEKEIPVEVLERAGTVQNEEGKWGKPLGETLTEETAKEDAKELKAPKKTVKKKPAAAKKKS